MRRAIRQICTNPPASRCGEQEKVSAHLIRLRFAQPLSKAATATRFGYRGAALKSLI